MKSVYYVVIGLVVVGAIAAYFLFSKPSYQPMLPKVHLKGAENAAVTITEFSDFQCPFCGAVEPTLSQLMSEYSGKIKLVYKHFPLPSHQNAQKAAEASECAAEHGKFWEYHDKLFANQGKLYKNGLIQYAKEIGLDENSFLQCLDSGVMADRVKTNSEEGQRLGVRGTPAFFINNRMVSGNQPISAFRAIINQELEIT